MAYSSMLVAENKFAGRETVLAWTGARECCSQWGICFGEVCRVPRWVHGEQGGIFTENSRPRTHQGQRPIIVN